MARTQQPDNVRRHLQAALETRDAAEKQYHIRQALQYCDDEEQSAVVVEE